MDENKKSEIEALVDEIRVIKEKLDEERALFDEQKRSLEASNIDNPGKLGDDNKMNEWRDIYDAMNEKRAITLSGTGRVAVINQIVKEAVAKKPLLGMVSRYTGPNASTNIPVLSPSIAVPAGRAEGAGDVTEDSQAKLGVTALTPYAYVSVLPVTAETLLLTGSNIEAELPNIFADAFAEAMQAGMLTGSGANAMKGIFNETGMSEINCAASGAPTMADIVGLALAIQDKFDNAVIVMNPSIYAGITAAAGDDYQVYREELIRNKTVEGVKVILTSYAPKDTTNGKIVAVGGDLKNYALGVAAEMTIEPLKKVGNVSTFYQASMFFNGASILPKNFVCLKAIA